MPYVNLEEGREEFEQLSEEKQKEILRQISREYSDWCYNVFLPALREAEKEAGNTKIIIGSLENMAA